MKRVLAAILAIAILVPAAVHAAVEAWPGYNLRDPTEERLMDMRDSRFRTHFTAHAAEAMMHYAKQRVPITDVVRMCSQAFANLKTDYSGTIYSTLRDITEEEMRALLEHQIVYFFPAFLAVKNGKGPECVARGYFSEQAYIILRSTLPLLASLIKDGEIGGKPDILGEPDEAPDPVPAPRGATGQ